MSDDDEMLRVSHRVPSHVRDAAQAQTEHGELSKMVRSLYKRIAFGDTDGGAEAVEIELERVRAEKDEIREEIRSLQQELQTLEQQETRLEEKQSKHRSRRDKYEGHLESLEEQLYDGTHLDPGHPSVVAAAEVIGASPGDVVEDLKDRNPGIPDGAFMEMRATDVEWTGVQAEEADR